MKFESNHSFVR